MPLTLLRLAESKSIAIKWWDFKPPLEAVYWRILGLPPIIGLSYLLKQRSRAHFRCVLAEELGHHFTTSTNTLPQTFFHYQDRLEVSKTEFKALKWAALYLIPREDLLYALKHGITKRWDLAEIFNVTETMLDFRMKLPYLT